MSTNADERATSDAIVTGKDVAQQMLFRVLGIISVAVCVLAVYFATVAAYLDGSAVAAADVALVRALKVFAGACAIFGLMVGMYVLTRRDAAILEAKRAKSTQDERS